MARESGMVSRIAYDRKSSRSLDPKSASPGLYRVPESRRYGIGHRYPAAKMLVFGKVPAFAGSRVVPREPASRLCIEMRGFCFFRM
jgi:hypothetical protein